VVLGVLAVAAGYVLGERARGLTKRVMADGEVHRSLLDQVLALDADRPARLGPARELVELTTADLDDYLEVSAAVAVDLWALAEFEERIEAVQRGDPRAGVGPREALLLPSRMLRERDGPLAA
jgi:hypothetical protein